MTKLIAQRECLSSRILKAYLLNSTMGQWPTNLLQTECKTHKHPIQGSDIFKVIPQPSPFLSLQARLKVLISIVSLVFDPMAFCSIVYPIQKAIFFPFHPSAVSFRLKPTYPTAKICDMVYVLIGNSWVKHQQWKPNAKSPFEPFSFSLC